MSKAFRRRRRAGGTRGRAAGPGQPGRRVRGDPGGDGAPTRPQGTGAVRTRQLRPTTIGGFVCGLLFAVAWAFGLWLIVLGSFSAGVILIRQQVLARRQVPTRLAAWALHAPRGLSPPPALEHAITVDLAAVSQGHLDSLDRAQAVVANSVDDPWRRALAAERLAGARHVIAGDGLVGIKRRQDTPAARVRPSAGAVALMALLAVGTISQSRWWLIPLAVVNALLTLEFVGL